MENTTCKYCGFQILSTYTFCPNCGKKLINNVSVSLSAQIGIYAVSLILPPLGLWPAIKYLRSPNEKAKMVGLIAVILTVVSTILTLWFTISLYNSLLGGFTGGGVDSLQNMGY